ncbi:MAG: rRNA pseudouridine synthase [Caldimicrobium sp.]|nr:rRNA pseudouridine synthase [Caldimicrobium sp.]MCX7874421.1 rRNA pseudouridine synthase [Caldimicrobium sp.]MDW8093994.1 pseudouridine synthase [Caldimicrobium sp.]
MRLSKYLALCGLGSRRKNKDLILQGRITVNGEIIKDLSYKVDLNKDLVCLDGKELKAPPKVYYLFYKPRGYLTSLYDPHHRLTIRKFLEKIPFRVFPVGRLDKESEGLILLTNDGDLAHFLLHPRYEIKRTYRVWVEPKLDERRIQQLLVKGINIEGKVIRPLKFSFIGSSRHRFVYEVIVKEGLKREVRKMVSVLGGRVTKLVRTAFGPLKLKDLRPGEIRPLNYQEIKSLMALMENSSMDKSLMDKSLPSHSLKP